MKFALASLALAAIPAFAVVSTRLGTTTYSEVYVPQAQVPHPQYQQPVYQPQQPPVVYEPVPAYYEPLIIPEVYQYQDASGRWNSGVELRRY